MRQPRRFAAIANSRPSSPAPSNIKVARYMGGSDSPGAMARLDGCGGKKRALRQREEVMRSLLLVTAAALLLGAAPPKKKLTPNEIVAAAPASAWRAIPADDLLILDI